MSFIGKRIKIIGDHPWEGETGKLVAEEREVGLFKKPAFRVRLDNGIECFVFSTKNILFLKEG
jgi:hypothetical protein